jgi:hypothetical protein
MSSIEKAHAYYQTSSSHDAKLPASQLIVLPVIEQQVKFKDKTGNDRQESIFMTDNMAFMPDLAGDPAFIVFPKGPHVRELGIWKNINLWESEWVIAHEYGHHIFMHHTQALKNSLQSINVHNIPTHAPFRSVKNTNAVALVGKNAPFGAVNEAFADLFGFFSVKQQSAAMNSLDCFRKSRDVSSAQFDTGGSKILTSEVLEIFGGVKPQIQSQQLGCGAPDYSEVHSVGALIAHAFYEVVKASEYFNKISVHDQAYANLIIEWPNALASKYGSKVILTPKFEPLLNPFLQIVAQKQNGKLNKKQCEIVAAKLPAISAGTTEGLCNESSITPEN